MHYETSEFHDGIQGSGCAGGGLQKGSLLPRDPIAFGAVGANPVERDDDEKKKAFSMAMYGYVRCSTDKQTVMQQVDALRVAGCERRNIYKDKAVSATAKSRPGLMAVKNALGPGDTFVVVAIDRAFRSAIDAINFLDDVLNKRGVVFLSLRDRIDTSTPWGRRDYIKLAAEAECERSVIAIRTREKMAALKRRGRKFGRPRKLTKKKLARAKAALRTGKSVKQVARSLCVSSSTVHRALASSAGMR